MTSMSRIEPLPANEGTIDDLNRADYLAKHDPVQLTDWQIRLLSAYDPEGALRARDARQKALNPEKTPKAPAAAVQQPSWTEDVFKAFFNAFEKSVNKDGDDSTANDALIAFVKQNAGLRVPFGAFAHLIALVGDMNRKNRERNDIIGELRARIETLEQQAERDREALRRALE